jgi:hypothetical protein
MPSKRRSSSRIRSSAAKKIQNRFRSKKDKNKGKGQVQHEKFRHEPVQKFKVTKLEN